MKATLALISGILLLAGCASFQEAYHADQEYGVNSLATWQQQLAHPDVSHAGQVPEGQEGIIAEEVMDEYIDSYSEEAELDTDATRATR